MIVFGCVSIYVCGFLVFVCADDWVLDVCWKSVLNVLCQCASVFSLPLCVGDPSETWYVESCHFTPVIC